MLILFKLLDLFRLMISIDSIKKWTFTVLSVIIITIQMRIQNGSYPVVRRVDESIVVTRTILAGGENRWQIETLHLLCSGVCIWPFKNGGSALPTTLTN